MMPGFRDMGLYKRVAVAIVFAPLIAWLFYYRGFPLFVFLMALTAVGQHELYGMFRHKVRAPHQFIGHIAGLLIVADAYTLRSQYFFTIFIVALMTSFFTEIVSRKSHKLENVTLSLFATVYPATFILFLIRIDQIRFIGVDGYVQYILLYTLLVTWLFDTASYFSGMLFGQNPFFPDISPKKSFEGFVGGMVTVAVIGMVTGLLVDPGLIHHFVFITIIIGLANQVGDLSESIIKRDTGTKDSSNYIPGHGGVLDRFDSLLFAAPAVYVYLLTISLIYGRVG